MVVCTLRAEAGERTAAFPTPHLRRSLSCQGSITLRIPQLLRAGCNKSVPFSHPLLPRRKRLWGDVDQQLAVLYLEGCSYRVAPIPC